MLTRSMLRWLGHVIKNGWHKASQTAAVQRTRRPRRTGRKVQRCVPRSFQVSWNRGGMGKLLPTPHPMEDAGLFAKRNPRNDKVVADTSKFRRETRGRITMGLLVIAALIWEVEKGNGSTHHREAGRWRRCFLKKISSFTLNKARFQWNNSTVSALIRWIITPDYIKTNFTSISFLSKI